MIGMWCRQVLFYDLHEFLQWITWGVITRIKWYNHYFCRIYDSIFFWYSVPSILDFNSSYQIVISNIHRIQFQTQLNVYTTMLIVANVLNFWFKFWVKHLFLFKWWDSKSVFSRESSWSKGNSLELLTKHR